MVCSIHYFPKLDKSKATVLSYIYRERERELYYKRNKSTQTAPGTPDTVLRNEHEVTKAIDSRN